MEVDGYKICPFCKEKIRNEAVKCRFCGEWLEQITVGFSGTQKPDQIRSPASFHKTDEQTPSVESKSETSTPSKPTTGISPRICFWVGSILLVLCLFVYGLSVFVTTQTPYWKQLSSGEQHYELTKLIINLLKVILGAGLLALVLVPKDKTKGKPRRFLVFALALVVFTTIFAFYFFKARNQAEPTMTEPNQQLPDQR